MQLAAFQVTGLRESTLNPCSSSQLFWYSSSASPEQSDKETNQSVDREGKAETEANGNDENTQQPKANEAEQSESEGKDPKFELSNVLVFWKRIDSEQTAFLA